MSTAESHNRPYTLSETNQRIRHPLQRLRGYIRLYIGIECVLLFVFFLALWYWTGLALDYGIFKLTSFSFLRMAPLDWMELSPAIFKVLRILIVLAIFGIIAYRSLGRLISEFRDPALALLLEHRFPKELSDRLITAVELANVKKQLQYGYSAAMIEQTIYEAAERVDQVPVYQVFNWRRLARQGAWLFAFTVGLWLVISGLFVVGNRTSSSSSVVAGLKNYQEVNTVWTQRNLITNQVYWPRRSQLEFINFPQAELTYDLGERAITRLRSAGIPAAVLEKLKSIHSQRFGTEELLLTALKQQLGDSEVEKYTELFRTQAVTQELRVGRETTTADLHVRALKWVCSDPKGQYGWRALEWSDLTSDILGAAAPSLPEKFQTQTPVTVDRVEEELNRIDETACLAIQKVLHQRDQLLGKSGITLGKTRTKHPVSKEEVETETLQIASDNAADKHEVNWKDIKELGSEIVGVDIPDLPGDWEGDDSSWTWSRLELTIQSLDLAFRTKLRADVFSRLEERFGNDSSTARVRKLLIPTDVKIFYWNAKAKISNEMTLTRKGDYEFTARLTDLSESIDFSIRGEDYYTPVKRIEVIPPPFLLNFACDQYRPAYIYYRLTDGMIENLASKKQKFENMPLLVSTGEINRLAFPSGTRLTFHGQADRVLKSAPTFVSGPDNILTGQKASLDENDRSLFTIEIPFEITSESDLVVQFVDNDNVTTTRRLKFEPYFDDKPTVEVEIPRFIRAIRDEVDYRDFKGNRVVTVSAWLPFEGKIRDDHGLNTVDMVFSLVPVEATSGKGASDFLLASMVVAEAGQTIGGSLRCVTYLNQFGAKKTPPKAPQEFRLPLQQFQDTLTRTSQPRRRGFRLSLEKLQTALENSLPADPDGLDPSKAPDEYIIEPELASHAAPRSGLDLTKLPLSKPLKVPEDSREIQARYRIRLNLEAVDNNPYIPNRKGSNKESFNFLVVSELELLTLIGREEEELHLELKKAVDGLLEAQEKLVKHLGDLPSANDLSLFSGKIKPVKEVEESIEKSLTITTKVTEDFDRILQEMQANRIQDNIQSTTQNQIVRPLQRIIAEAFPLTKQFTENLRKDLEDKNLDLSGKQARTKESGTLARTQLVDLLRQMNVVLSAMQGITDLSKEIARLRKVEEALQKQQGVYAQLHKELLEKLLGDVLDPATPKK